MIRIRTYVGVALSYFGKVVLLLSLQIKIPRLVIFIGLGSILIGLIIQVGHIAEIIVVQITGFLVLCLYVLIVSVIMVISFWVFNYPEETAFLISKIIICIGGIILILYEIYCCLTLHKEDQEIKRKARTKKKAKAKKIDALLSSLDDQADKDIDLPVIENNKDDQALETPEEQATEEDIAEGGLEQEEKSLGLEEDIAAEEDLGQEEEKARNIKNARINRANDDSYKFNAQFVDQLLKNAEIRPGSTKAEAFMEKWDKAEAKRQSIKTYFCPYCMVKVKTRDKLSDEYLCSNCNAKIKKENLALEDK